MIGKIVSTFILFGILSYLAINIYLNIVFGVANTIVLG